VMTRQAALEGITTALFVADDAGTALRPAH
jgi:hypothetical protein